MVKLTVSRQVWQGLKNIKDLKQAMIYLFCYFILNDVLGVGAISLGPGIS
jgi:MFS-type transporter involved in bile tolerance (Atg22 family)